MLTVTATPSDKRRALKQALDGNQLLRFVGAYAPLVALAIADAGFDGVYIGGSTLSSDLGLPDIGLVTQTEAVARGQAIAAATALPTLIDIDTGFGEAVNVARTIRALEDAGLAGCHLEDQVNPKRCGHLDNKQLISTDAMVEKLRAAVAARRDPDFLIIARTDARAVEGMDAAIARARAYADAGVDAIFPEAMQDEAEFAQFAQTIDKPLLANMTEFGRSRLLPAATLQQLGYRFVIYPVTTQRLAMFAVEEGLRELKAKGTQAGMVDRMQTRRRLYDLVRYDDYAAFDQSVASYDEGES